VSVEIDSAEGVVALPFEEFEERVRRGLVPAHTKVRVEVLTGRRFVPAGELEFYHALADPSYVAFRRRLTTRAVPFVTAALVGLQVRIHLWSRVPEVSDMLVTHLTNWAPGALENGEIHRLWSYGFLHLDFTHLLLNMLFLCYFGYHLERGLGRWNLVAIYLFSVFCGALLSMEMSPGRPSLGASGGDFGLLAASVLFGWKFNDLIPRRSRRFYGWAVFVYPVVLLLLGWSSNQTVDNAGHLGGLLGGLAIAALLQPAGWTHHDADNRRVRRGTAVVMVAVAAAIWLRGPWFLHLSAWEDAEYGLTVEHPEYWDQGWSFTGDKGWRSPTETAWLVARTRRDRPMTLADAEEAFLDQLQVHGARVSVEATWDLEVAGSPARELTLTYTQLGSEGEMRALLIARGAFVHRLYLHYRADRAYRYRQLWERVKATLDLDVPVGLQLARAAARDYPRRPQILLSLGRAAALAGYPDEAAEALTTAHELARSDEQRSDIAVELLELYVDYGVWGTWKTVDALVHQHEDDLDVLVVAAAAYLRAGAEADAALALETAWRLAPGHFTVRRAYETLGFGVPSTPSEDEEGAW